MNEGNLRIPDDYICEGYRLGRWIGTQRYEYGRADHGNLTAERIQRLEKIGMIWDVNIWFWQEMYEALRKYREQNGHVRVPQSYVTPDGRKLGIWVNKQRMEYKKGSLTEKRRLLLEALGMIWQPELLRRGTWDDYFKLLEHYTAEHDGEFSDSHFVTADGRKLGVWLSNQRANYHTGKLLPERKRQLEELGIIWNVLEKEWLDHYAQAAQYYRRNGHLCLFSQRDGSAPKQLGTWLTNQRKAYYNQKLPSRQIKLLENIGMIWDVRDASWNTMYEEAAQYYRQHGDLQTV